MEQEVENLILTYSSTALALNALYTEYKANPCKATRQSLLAVALLSDLATWGFSLDYLKEFSSNEEGNNGDNRSN